MIKLTNGIIIKIPMGPGKPAFLNIFQNSQIDTIITRDEIIESITVRRSEERRVGEEGRSRWSPYH